MKMYHLNPNGYGMSFFVLATSKNEAIELISKSGVYGGDGFIGLTENSLVSGYTIDEFDFGKVIAIEQC